MELDDFEKQCMNPGFVDEDGGESEEEEEEEEEKIWLKPPDPCLLCGEPAVHYDAEGKVIKRETPAAASSRLQSEDGDYSGFFACVFKCFRVEEGNRNRGRRPKSKWKSEEEGGPLPICESCEELVALLLQMYDKVEELESKIKTITTEAEQIFETDELYKRGDDDGDGEFYAEFRGSLKLKLGQKRTNTKAITKSDKPAVEPVPPGMSRRTRGNRKRRTSNSWKAPTVTDDGDGGGTPTKRASKQRSTSADSSSALVVSLLLASKEPLTPELSSESIKCDKPDKTTHITNCSTSNPLPADKSNASSSQSSSSSSAGDADVTPRRRSLRARREVANKKYVELSSEPLESDDDDDEYDDRSISPADSDSNFDDNEESSSCPPLAATSSRPMRTTTAAEASTTSPFRTEKKRRYRKRKEGRNYSGDRICRVDRTTGNIHYSVVQSNQTKSAALHLEFVKQQSSANYYECAQCSRLVEFPSDNKISRVALIAHVRRFHPTGRSTTCPVCGMPLASSTNSAYYDHRLSHLSEPEREQALANPIFTKRRADGTSSAPRPRFPPLPSSCRRRRTIITPQVALLRGDVNQCPTCARFIAGGPAGLRNHERTHLPVPVEVEQKKKKKGRRLVSCAHCGAGFTNKQSLEYHILGNHPGIDVPPPPADRSAKCQYPGCQRAFPDESALKSHVSQEHHSSTSKMGRCLCLRCGRVLTTNSSLKNHALIHSKEEKAHACPHCPSRRAFRIKGRLNSHLASVHGEGPASGHFPCGQPGCDKEYTSRNPYYRHMRSVHKMMLSGGSSSVKRKAVGRRKLPKTTPPASSSEPPPAPSPEASSSSPDDTTIIIISNPLADNDKFQQVGINRSKNNDGDGDSDRLEEGKCCKKGPEAEVSEETSSSNKMDVVSSVALATEADPAATSTQFARTGKRKIIRRSGKGKERIGLDDLCGDRKFRVDSKTGNISYCIRTTRPARSSDNPSADDDVVRLEFVKQSDSDTSYKCDQCCRTVCFARDKKISRTVLLAHARRFHPTGMSGLCPVCEKPLASLVNAEYYDHRFTHLSEEEKTEALANPVYAQRGGRFPKPRFPPLPPSYRRKNITPEVASLRGDVNQCPTCGKFISRGISALRRHELTHLPPEEKRTFLCAACGAGFTAKYSLDMHVLAYHPGDDNEDGVEGKIYRCGLCPRQFKTEKSLGAHMKHGVHMHRAAPTRSRGTRRPKVVAQGTGEEDDFPFQCSKCPSSFRSPRGLLMHNTHRHGRVPRAKRVSGMYTCRLPHCRMRFGTAAERLAHYSQAHPTAKEAIEARPPDSSVRCCYPECTQGFPDESHLQSHVSTEHGGGSQGSSSAGGSMCSLCGKVLSNDWSLSQHALTHSKEKKVGCPRCPRTFITKPLLLSHLAAVHGEGPVSGHFPCEQPGCDKEYRSRYMYYQHMRQVHNLIASTKGGKRQRRNGGGGEGGGGGKGETTSSEFNG